MSEFFFRNFFSLSMLQNFSMYLFEATLYCNLLGSIVVLFKKVFISSKAVNLIGCDDILFVFNKFMFCSCICLFSFSKMFLVNKSVLFLFEFNSAKNFFSILLSS